MDVLESSGLKGKGYSMIQVDSGWMRINRTTRWLPRANYTERPRKNDRQGYPVFPSGGKAIGCLLPDLTKFPEGMKAFGEKLKSRGFRFGLYTSGEDGFCSPTTDGIVYGSSPRYNLDEIDAKCLITGGSI